MPEFYTWVNSSKLQILEEIGESNFQFLAPEGDKLASKCRYENNRNFTLKFFA